jgi:hypothetical protein
MGSWRVTATSPRQLRTLREIFSTPREPIASSILANTRDPYRDSPGVLPSHRSPSPLEEGLGKGEYWPVFPAN